MIKLAVALNLLLVLAGGMSIGISIGKAARPHWAAFIFIVFGALGVGLLFGAQQ